MELNEVRRDRVGMDVWHMFSCSSALYHHRAFKTDSMHFITSRSVFTCMRNRSRGAIHVREMAFPRAPIAADEYGVIFFGSVVFVAMMRQTSVNRSHESGACKKLTDVRVGLGGSEVISSQFSILNRTCGSSLRLVSSSWFCWAFQR